MGMDRATATVEAAWLILAHAEKVIRDRSAASNTMGRDIPPIYGVDGRPRRSS